MFHQALQYFRRVSWCFWNCYFQLCKNDILTNNEHSITITIWLFCGDFLPCTTFFFAIGAELYSLIIPLILSTLLLSLTTSTYQKYKTENVGPECRGHYLFKYLRHIICRWITSTRYSFFYFWGLDFFIQIRNHVTLKLQSNSRWHDNWPFYVLSYPKAFLFSCVS